MMFYYMFHENRIYNAEPKKKHPYSPVRPGTVK